MNILKKLTIQNLKLNKKRTIATIIAIILSTALICATLGLVTSFQRSLLEDAINNQGEWHTQFGNISAENLKYIKENRNISKVILTENLGYVDISKESKNLYKPYLHVEAFTQEAWENYKIKLIEGRLPENENEIIIPEHLYTNGEVNYKVGDKLILKLSKRVDNDTKEELTQERRLEDEGDVNAMNIVEHLEPIEDKEYIIVGKIERPRIEPYQAPGYTVITALKEENSIGKYNVAVVYKDVKETYENTAKIEKVLQIEEQNENIELDYNSNVLRWSGVSKNDNTNAMIFSVSAIILGIIIFTAIWVIKNSFQMMVMEKNKQYGMLASIGATSKQIKRNILYEGVLMGMIGIPIGILGAMLAVYLLILFLNMQIANYMQTQFYFYFPILTISIGTFLSLFTIYLSCILPARKASKISPIEAIRQTKDIKIKANQIRMPKIIKKVFKVGGEISYKNLKRSKKKYRATILSIIISIIIFIAISSITRYALKLGNIYYETRGYNLLVSGEKEIYDQILKLDNIESYAMHKTIYIQTEEKDINENMIQYSGSNDGLVMGIVSVGEEEYERLIKKIGITPEEANKGAILYDKINAYNNDKYEIIRATNLKEKDTMIAEIIKDKTKVEIPIISVNPEYPMGIGENSHKLVVSEKYFKKLQKDYQLGSLYIKTNNIDELTQQIDNILKANPNNTTDYTNYDIIEREAKSMETTLYVFLYGFIIVITIIGMTNIFNTITTNMLLRSKEFANLKSIGMTQKEFNKMIRLESIFYGAKSLLIGIPLGMLVSYYIYKAFGNSIEMGYEIPVMPIVLSIIFVFLIVWTTMQYALKKINKQNIIETIRNDNI